MIKKLALLGFSLMVLLGNPIIHAASQETQPIPVLFIQNSPKGILTPIPEKADYYQLKMEQIPSYMPFITYKPIRISGIYPTEKYFSNWERANSHASPNKIPPTAGLSAIESTLLKETPVNLTIELTSPMYDVKANSMTFIVHILKGNQIYVPKHELKNISLFIDDHCADCTGSHF